MACDSVEGVTGEASLTALSLPSVTTGGLVDRVLLRRSRTSSSDFSRTFFFPFVPLSVTMEDGHVTLVAVLVVVHEDDVVKEVSDVQYGPFGRDCAVACDGGEAMVPGDDADDGEDGGGYSRDCTDVITDREDDEDDPHGYTGVHVKVVAAGGDSAPDDLLTVVSVITVVLLSLGAH